MLQDALMAPSHASINTDRCRPPIVAPLSSCVLLSFPSSLLLFRSFPFAEQSSSKPRVPWRGPSPKAPIPPAPPVRTASNDSLLSPMNMLAKHYDAMFGGIEPRNKPRGRARCKWFYARLSPILPVCPAYDWVSEPRWQCMFAHPNPILPIPAEVVV